MRSYGRDAAGNWVVLTDENLIWLATLVQSLRLVLGESPFYALYGVPAQQAVWTQVAPDAAVARMQAAYSQYFSSLSLSRDNTADEPTYNIQAVLLNGAVVSTSTVAT